MRVCGHELLFIRNEIVDLVNAIAMSADSGDWEGVRSCFADRVLLDYTSMSGGEPAEMTPDEIVRAWRGLLPGFEATHHTVTNHRVEIDGDEADCLSHVTAIHYLPSDPAGDTWTVLGLYHHHLVKTSFGWKVDRMRFDLRLTTGNPDLPRLARERAERGSD